MDDDRIRLILKSSKNIVFPFAEKASFLINEGINLLKSLKEENDKKTTAGDDEEVKQCEEQSEELLNVGMDDVNQVINGLENNNAFNNGLDIPSFPGF